MNRNESYRDSQERIFQEIAELERHAQATEAVPGVYCRSCGSVFRDFSRLADSRYQCPQCGGGLYCVPLLAECSRCHEIKNIISEQLCETCYEKEKAQRPPYKDSHANTERTQWVTGTKIVSGVKGLVLLGVYLAVVFGILKIYSVNPILGFIVTSIFVLFLLFSGGRSGPDDSGHDHQWWEGLRSP